MAPVDEAVNAAVRVLCPYRIDSPRCLYAVWEEAFIDYAEIIRLCVHLTVKVKWCHDGARWDFPLTFMSWRKVRTEWELVVIEQ